MKIVGVLKYENKVCFITERVRGEYSYNREIVFLVNYTHVFLFLDPARVEYSGRGVLVCYFSRAAHV